jgi:hypothetical protein
MKTLFVLLTFITFIAVATDTKSADTNTVSSTVIDKSVPTANAPSVVVNNSDICMVATSGAIQTNILGIATGIMKEDVLCAKLRLSSRLFSMGMKVAAVSVLCLDSRTWDSMYQAGTYCPYDSKIGKDAKQGWLENPEMIPDGSLIKANLLEGREITVEEREANNDLTKFIFMAMAMYIGFPILF